MSVTINSEGFPVTQLIYLALPVIISLSWMKYRGLEYVLVNYRWIFVIFFLMPVSLIYDIYMFIRNWYVFKVNSAPHKHQEKVATVQGQVCIIHSFSGCGLW